jgi:hypothetical protein
MSFCVAYVAVTRSTLLFLVDERKLGSIHGKLAKGSAALTNKVVRSIVIVVIAVDDDGCIEA